MRTRSNVYLYLWENQSKEGWLWDFPGGSVLRLSTSTTGSMGSSSRWKLRSYMPPSVAKRRKKKKKEGWFYLYIKGVYKEGV